MTALPAANDIVRIALIGKLDEDSDVVNRFYYYTGGGVAPANLNALATAIANAWNSSLAAQFPTNYTLQEVVCEDLTSATAPVGNAVVSHVGTRSGTKLSASACALIRFHIGRRYRGGHPRMYLCAGTQADTTDAQTWSPTFLSGLLGAWSAFIAAVTTAVNSAYGGTGSGHYNVSYYKSFTNVTYPSGRTYPRPSLRSTPTLDPVTTYDANPKIASQRRRNLTP